MERLICFFIINLMLRCFLFKKRKKKINESCSLSKAARMSSTYFKYLKIILIWPLKFVKMHENIGKNRSQRELMATPSI